MNDEKKTRQVHEDWRDCVGSETGVSFSAMTTRRIKNYTAETGLVWEYYFVGKRPAMGERELSATEYVYDVSSDRQKTKFAVSVFVRQDALETWVAMHGRS